MFSSLGVLLAGKSLGLCGHDDSRTTPEILIFHSGMTFLRSVSKYSILARRYLLLLEKYYGDANDDATVIPSDHLDPSGDALVGLPDLDQAESERRALPTIVHQSVSVDNFGSDDVANIHFPNPNEFLYGMGLPQEFLTMDWPFLEPRTH